MQESPSQVEFNPPDYSNFVALLNKAAANPLTSLRVDGVCVAGSRGGEGEGGIGKTQWMGTVYWRGGEGCSG